MGTPIRNETNDAVVPFGDDLLAEIEQAPFAVESLSDAGAVVGELLRRAEHLATAARGRQPLEALRSTFIRRLHRRSDDSGATEGLRAVEGALSLVGWP
jgi:hypothetical protein